MPSPSAVGDSTRTAGQVVSAAVGPARVLVLGYGFFVLAAGARSGVQIATKFSDAPLAYLLSAASAAIYLTGLIVFIVSERNPERRRTAGYLCLVELTGVIIVGLASLLDPAAFADSTVWSRFGAGYAYTPIALPLLGLCWASLGQHQVTGPDLPRLSAVKRGDRDCGFNGTSLSQAAGDEEEPLPRQSRRGLRCARD